MLKILVLSSLFFFLVSCSILNPSPELTWDPHPEAVILRTSSDGGMEPMAAHYNRIPNAVIWGDGRFVWQTFGENGVRQVWQSQLNEEEMRDLLQTFADKGFWRMKPHYDPNVEVFDSSSTSLQVNLLEEYKSVSEYHDGAPKAFHELVGFLSNGAGTEGQPYVPQTGYLSLYPMEPYEGMNDIPVWDADAAQISLNQVEDGQVEGALLQQAWHIVNQSYWSSMVVDDGEYYEIYLQMPELTGQDPS